MKGRVLFNKFNAIEFVFGNLRWLFYGAKCVLINKFRLANPLANFRNKTKKLSNVF